MHVHINFTYYKRVELLELKQGPQVRDIARGFLFVSGFVGTL